MKGKLKALALRAHRLANLLGHDYPLMDAMMDLDLSNVNLENLAKFGDGDFAHDVFGIRRYFDRRRMVLTQCFLPRAGLLN